MCKLEGVEQSVINDGIDQWRRHLHACITAMKTFQIFTVTKINFVKIYC